MEYITPEVPPDAATSPLSKTFNAKALFGWSPALYVIGTPTFNPVSFDDFKFVIPWLLKLSTKSGVKFESIP